MPATFGRRPDGDDQVYLEEDTDDGGFSGRAPPQVALALDLDFRDRLTQFPHHSAAVRGGLRGCLGKVLSISRGRLLMGVVGLGLLLAFIVFMVEKTDSRLLDEAKCPDQARVYYPLRTHRRKFIFMFCCHCCALKQPTSATRTCSSGLTTGTTTRCPKRSRWALPNMCGQPAW